MPEVTVNYAPVEPVKPKVDSITVTMSVSEAQAVAALLGRCSRQRGANTYKLFDELNECLGCIGEPHYKAFCVDTSEHNINIDPVR